MSASHARVALAAAEGAFARVYVHAGMVSYHGEKMSKSLGNLVFVSRLLADGVDPMAIRMALLAHHYRSDWEWTDAVLGDAEARLARWRAALARAEAAVPEPGAPAAEAAAPASAAEMVLAGVRARMRDDLDAPGALAVVDRWADALLAEPPTRITSARPGRRPPRPGHRRRPPRHQPLARRPTAPGEPVQGRACQRLTLLARRSGAARTRLSNQPVDNF